MLTLSLPTKAISHDRKEGSALGHLDALDGVRGLAIVLVLFAHSCCFIGRLPQQDSCDQAMLFFAEYGTIGIDLFLVLSGFLITRILLATRDSRHYYRDFYIRRVLRIMPLYYIYLLLIFHVVAPLVHDVPTNAEWSCWLYVMNFEWLRSRITGNAFTAHLWTLCIEEQFYLTWPALIGCVSPNRIARAMLCIVFGAMLLRTTLAFLGWNDECMKLTTIARVDASAVGGLLAYAYTKKRFDVLKRCSLLIIPGLTILFLRSALLMKDAQSPPPHFDYNALFSATGYTVLASGFLALVLVNMSRTTILRSFLQNRILHSFSKYSYSIYLCHFPLMFVLIQLPLAKVHAAVGSFPTWLLFFGSLASISWAIAWLTYRVIEKPFLNLKDVLAPDCAH